MKLGVVIPYYRTNIYREMLLLELVELLKSEVKDYSKDDVQIVIVEDGTKTDFLNRLNKEDHHFEVIRLEENQGISKARNVGIEYCLKDCEYIVFIDSDDFIESDYISSLIHQITFDKKYDCQELAYFTNFKMLNKHMVEGMSARITGIAIHKDVFKEGVRFDENLRFGEDIDFVDKYLRNRISNPFFININYYYNLGIDKQCLSYQALRKVQNNER